MLWYVQLLALPIKCQTEVKRAGVMKDIGRWYLAFHTSHGLAVNRSSHTFTKIRIEEEKWFVIHTERVTLLLSITSRNTSCFGDMANRGSERRDDDHSDDRGLPLLYMHVLDGQCRLGYTQLVAHTISLSLLVYKWVHY